MVDKKKTAPARRRAKVLTFQRKDHAPMTPETRLYMPPVYALLEANGVEWRRIPEKEVAFVVGQWRRDRIARRDWRVDWQPDGEAFVLAYAMIRHWYDDDIVDQMNMPRVHRKPGDITEAERDAMGYEKWLEWSSKDID